MEEDKSRATPWYREDAEALENAANAPTAKRLASFAALGTGVNQEVYRNVNDELMSSGISPTYYQAEAVLEAQRRSGIIDFTNEVVAGEGTLEEKLATVNRASEEYARKPTMEELAIDSILQNATAETPLARQGQYVIEKNREKLLRNIPGVAEEAARLVEQHAAGLNPNLGSTGLEFVSSALLPGFQLRIGAIHERVNPSTYSPSDYVLPGNAIKKFRDMFYAASDEDQVRIVRELIAAVQEISPNVVDNSITEYEAIQDFLGGLDPASTDMPIEQAFLNVFGVLDLIPVVETLSKPIKGMALRGTKIIRSSAAARLSQTGVDDARAVFKDILATKNEELADALGTTVEQIAIDTILPKGRGESIHVNPDLGPTAREIADILNYNPMSGLLFDTERAVQRQSLEERIGHVSDSYQEAIPNFQLSKTTVEDVDGAIEADMVFGASATRGFPDYKSALIFGKAQVGVAPDLSNMRVLYRDFTDDTIKEFDPASSVSKTEGEFYVQVRVREPYHDIISATEGFHDSDFVGLTGKGAAYTTIGSAFSRRVVSAINVASDRQPAVQKALGAILEPYMKSNRSIQTRVLQVLNDEDRLGLDFTREQVMERVGGDEKAYRAWQSVREFLEIGRQLLNRQKRPALVAEGQKDVTVMVTRKNPPPGEPTVVPVRSMGRVLEEPPMRVTAAFDPSESKVIRLTDEEVTALYEQGGRLIETKSKFRAGGHSTDHIIYRKDDTVKVSELPENIIKRIPGYLPRIYDAQYIVGRQVKGMHNYELEEYFSPVSVFSNRGEAEAEALLRTINSGADGKEEVEYVIKQSRELDRVDPGKKVINLDSFEYLEQSGQLFYSPRGKELRPLQDTISGERSLRSVSESIDAARASIARQVSTDVLVENLTKRWEATFGEAFGAPGGKMPIRGDLPKNSDITDSAIEARYKQAIAMRDRIAMIAGVDEGAMRSAYSRGMIKLADALSVPEYGGIRNRMSAMALREAQKDPTRLPKKAAFYQFIIANPIRQLALQSQQLTVYAGLDHTLPYLFGGGMVRDYMALTSGLATRNTRYWPTMRANIAKARNMSEEEAEEFIDAFKKSGLTQGIDSHDYVAIFADDGRNISRTNNTAWDATARAWRNGTRFFRRFGFDTGELSQLMGAFLVSRNRWKVNNPDKAAKWADDVNLSRIVADAREISLNMNSGDASRFQRGGLGLMFQFMSHTTKSFQMLIPNKFDLGSKWLNDVEKRRIAIIQALVYGTGGFGLNRTWEAMTAEAGVEVPPEVNKIVEEGMLGYTINLIAAAADQEPEYESDIEFSQSFAPLAGTAGNVLPFLEAGAKLGRAAGLDIGAIPIPDAGALAAQASNPIAKLVEATLLSPPGLFEFFFGPSGTSALTLADRGSQALFILGEGLRGDIPEDESAALLAAEEWFKVIPAFNNTIQAIGASKFGTFFDSKGSPTVAASSGEIFAKGLLGLRSRRENQQQDFLRNFSGMRLTGVEGVKTQLEDAARTLYEHHSRLVRQVSGGTMDIDTFYRVTHSEMQALRDGLYPEQWAYTMLSLRRRMLADVSADGVTPKVIKAIETALHSNAINPGSATVTKIKNMSPFEGQEEIVRLVENLFNERRQ